MMKRDPSRQTTDAGRKGEPETVRQHRSGFQLALLAMSKDKLALAGSVVAVLAVLIAILAPWISPYDPNEADMVVGRLAPPFTPGHLLGTDGQTRDILSRLIWGGRISLPIAAVPILLSSFFGIVLGVVAGWCSGIVSIVIMRSLDVIFAFPGVLLAVAIAAIMGAGMLNVSLSMAIVLLPYVSRIVYIDTVRIRRSTFIEAARVCGMGTMSILLREVVPNIISPVIVYGTTALGGMVVFAAGLSFLGIGVQPPAADWGIMASDGRDVLLSAAWVSLAPGLTIVVVAVALNFVGDGLRDALDPRLRTRR
jgi:peptide/nickel transport system permease protein